MDEPGLFDGEAAGVLPATPRPWAGERGPGAPDAPLATRLRPTHLDEVVGQERLTGPGGLLRLAVERRRVPSLILWGPPGSGKTTLARILAEGSGQHLEALSAVASGVADLRKVVEAARARRRAGQGTLLFLDEIHRFNRAQQDALLPHVESGLLTLVGATTENPSFEVNSALLSRSRVAVLAPLEAAAIDALLDRALADGERGLGHRRLTLSPAARALLTTSAGGDARVALNALELAALDHADGTAIGAEAVTRALQAPTLLHDRAGDQHFWVISAFIKSVRSSDPDAALYWLARMLEAGEDPLFVARRLVVLAAEDVGLADPGALPLAAAAHQAAHVLGMPEAALPLTEATLHLALAPKSNSVKTAYAAAAAEARATPALPVPLWLRNAATAHDRQMGFGQGYQYAHDDPEAVVDHPNRPPELTGHRYYRPGTHGAEPERAAHLDRLRAAIQRRRAGRAPGAPPPEGGPDGSV